MTLEITQALLSQLMGFIFSVALIYLAIAFAMMLMRRRAAINPLSDHVQSSQSPLQSSLPFQDSLVNSMEPVLDWFEPTDQASAPQSDKERRPHRAQLTEASVAKSSSLSEGRHKLISLAKPPITSKQIVPTFDTTASALTGQLVDGFFQDDDDEMFAADESSRLPQTVALKPEVSKQALQQKDKQLRQNGSAPLEQSEPVGEELTEPAIAQSNGVQQDQLALSKRPEPVGEELTEPEISEFEELFSFQVEMSAAAAFNEARQEDASQPADPGQENSQATEPMPPEFDDIWTLVGKPESALGVGAAGLFADLEALLKPEAKAVQLDQSIADIEELANLNLDNLFTSQSKVSPSAQYRPKPMQELDGPTEEELEEIFGSQFQLTTYPKINQS